MRFPFNRRKRLRETDAGQIPNGSAVDSEFHHFSAHMKKDLGLADKDVPHVARHHPVAVIQGIMFRNDR